MKRPNILFPILWGCAWCLERVLPMRVYQSLYFWCRLFYDMVILGRKPSSALSGYRVPPRDSEEYDLAGRPLRPVQSVDAPAPQGSAGSLSDPEGGLLLCTGERLAAQTLPGSDAARVRAWLEPVRTSCAMVICCAFRGRTDLLEQVVLESLAAEGGKGVRWMLAGSTDEDRRLIESLAARTGRVAGFICKNDPLGRKWQTCVQYGYHLFDAALFAVTGSDDILSSRLIDHVLTRHKVNAALLREFTPDLYCTNEWLVHGTAGEFSPMLLRCSYRYDTIFMPLGAGRFYARKFMDDVGGYLFDSSRPRGLDRNGYELLKARSGLIEYYTVDDGPVVSVKGDWDQLNSLESFFLSNRVDVREYAFKGYPLLRASLSGGGFRYLFKPTDIGFQLFD